MKILFVENSQITPFSAIANAFGKESICIVDRDTKDLGIFAKDIDVVVTSPDVENVERFIQIGKPVVVCRENLSSVYPFFKLDPFADIRYVKNTVTPTYQYDVGLFCDYIPLDEQTLLTLTHIGKEPLGWGGEFSIIYDGVLEDRPKTPAGITMYNRFLNSVVKRILVVQGTQITLSLGKCFLSPFWGACQTLSNVISGSVPLVDQSIYGLISNLLTVDNLFSTREEAAKKIYYYLSDSENRKKSISSISEVIMQHHSSTVCANRLLKFINSL